MLALHLAAPPRRGAVVPVDVPATSSDFAHRQAYIYLHATVEDIEGDLAPNVGTRQQTLDRLFGLTGPAAAPEPS